MKTRADATGVRSPSVSARSAPSVSDMPSGIEGHRILRELGRGGMGVVYLAREQGWNRDVALKVANRGLTERQERRFSEEAALTARLQHPVIVPIYRMGHTGDGRSYYSMKRVQGQTLAHLIMQVRDGSPKSAETFAVRRRAAILLAACEGVAYAHDQGVVHRDLKPSNIMVGDYGEVYVLDWGLARMLFAIGHPDELPEIEAGEPGKEGDSAESSATGTAHRRRISGTPAYMSPEQARGENKVIDRRSDVWSLGAILFQLLTLNPPVEGKDANEIIKNLAEGRLNTPEKFPGGRQAPRELLDILAKALQPDLNKRYASARGMADDLRDYLDGRGRWRLAYQWEHSSGTTPEQDWLQALGRWKVDAEGLYPASRKGKGAVLLSQRRYMGDVRIELTGFGSGPGPEAGELSVLLCAPEPEPGVNETDGYCLQFGADWNTSAKICKNDVDLTVRADQAFTPQRTYVVAGERQGNRLSLDVDGDELLAFDDLVPLSGFRVGIYGWGSGCRIKSIRVFRRGLDAVVSCMAVPDHDFNRGRFAEAFAGYVRIAEELSGREEGWMARFKAGLSRLESEDALGAEAEFAKLDGSPGEVLAHLGRAIISAREGDHRRELMRLGAARRTGVGTTAQGYVLARLWVRAEELFSTNQFETAIEYFKEAIEADSAGGKRRVLALAAVARSQLLLGRYDEAVRAVEKIEQQQTPYPEALRPLYESLVQYNADHARWDEALQCCEALDRQPGYGVYASIQRAAVERLRGRFKEAAAYLETASTQAEQPAQGVSVRFHQAVLELDEGRMDEALARLDELAAFKGTVELDARADERVNILAMKGLGTKALSMLATRLKHEDHRHRMVLLCQLGRMLRVRGECSRARECFSQALVHMRRYMSLAALEAELELGLTCLASKDRPAAAEAFNRVSTFAVNNFARLVVRSYREWRAGEPLPEPPDPGTECPASRRSDYFFYMGEYAQLSGRRDEALRAYKRALLESVSRYRHCAWLAAARLRELDEPLPKGTPDFGPLVRKRTGSAATERAGD
ncbi:MAG: protein kinase [Planctomycetes bacterium]|nr:protein kinase [Planctomycetota bacterium]